MVANTFRWWLERKNIIPKSQTGFRKGFSCVDNLASVAMYIEEAFQNDEHVLDVFLDVVGSFLNVQSKILADILVSIGCPPKLIKFCWFLIYERLIYREVNYHI